jgi:transposase
MTLDESVHGMRLRVIERAQVLGNVSVVCRELGISRTLFYRGRQRLERDGVDGVHPRRQGGRAGRPVATPPEVERLVLGIAISAATWGCRRIAAYLARTWQVRVAPSTVQRLLRRVGLATRRARLTVLEQQAARTAGRLTDRTRRTLWRARHGHTRRAARLSGHLLHRQSQRGRQGVADYGLRRRDLVWARRPAASPRGGGRRHVPARGRGASLPASRLAGAPRAHRRRAGIQGRR